MTCSPLLMSALLTLAPLLSAQTAPISAPTAQVTVQRLTMMLGLSSTQQQEALTIFTAEQTAELPIQTSEHLAQQLLKTAIQADNTASITEISAMLGQLSGQHTLAHSLAEGQFYAVLTTEQQTKYAQMVATDPGNSGGFAGGGPPPPRR